MPRLVKVQLNGFKGLTKSYVIAGPTILSGPNGAGKSACLQAINYALSGSVPAGKSLDAVALYYPPGGGTVKLLDEDNNWIERGIVRDHEKASVSEVLKTSDTTDGKITMDKWRHSAIALNIQAFIGLSPAKKREYILALCGGGTPEPERIIGEIGTRYAKEIAGAAATMNTLLTPDDLPADVIMLAHEWTKPRGVAEILTSYLSAPDQTTTQIFLAIGNEAKANRLGHRRAKDDAVQALRELEYLASGARFAAAEIENTAKVLATAEQRLAAGKENNRAREEAVLALNDATLRYTETQAGIERAEATLKTTEDPGAEPRRPKPTERQTQLKREIKIAQKRREELALEINEFEGLRNELDLNLAEEEAQKERMAELHKNDLFRAYKLSKQLNYRNVTYLELKSILADLCDRQQKAEYKYLQSLRNLRDRKQRVEKKVRNLSPRLSLWKKELQEVDVLLDRLLEEQRDLDAEVAKAIEEYDSLHLGWEAKQKAYDLAFRDVAIAKELRAQAERAKNQAILRLHRLGEDRDIGVLLAAHDVAKQKHERAQEAAGAIKAFEEAKANAKAAKISEAAWAVAEKAIASAREYLVGITTRPILEDMNKILEGASREERAYLQLENERGTPIFELGWVRNGARTSLPALSGGESSIFAAALSVAIIKRAEGRRVLLVEADPVDDENLRGLLTTLAPCATDLEALIVATAKVVEDVPGWRITHLRAL